MHEQLLLLQSTPGQAETVVNTVTKAYEKDVYVATIALLVVAVIGLFGLLIRSYRDRANELSRLNEKNEAAMLAQREKEGVRSQEQDQRIYGLLERVTEALVNVSNTVSNFTEELKALRGHR